ncbi:MAG TPA: hypothetical protein VJU82_13595 [Acidobacteriaceae bacterium]|nr:hypothetical protein [Acidobacteriaceae bacterium]
MRHIANIIDYHELYLLDDGTDTIEINKSRNSHGSHQHPAPEIAYAPLSPHRLLRHFFSSKYWTWSLAEAPRLTFFTVYDLELRPGDSLIRNDYGWLRSRSVGNRVSMPDTVVFIGQCIQDGNIELNTHLKFLARAREHFSEKHFIYVAHPRESTSCLDQVRRSLQCEIWPSLSVIEQDMFGRGMSPEVIAGFATSAHITLAYLMAPDVDIVCFELPPDCWLGWKTGASAFYEYVRKKMYPRIAVIPLSADECDCVASSSVTNVREELKRGTEVQL